MSADGEGVGLGAAPAPDLAGSGTPMGEPSKRARSEERRWSLVTTAVVVVVVVVIAGVAAYIADLYLFDRYSGEKPTSTLTVRPLDYGWNFTFGHVSAKTPWRDVELVLNDTKGSVSWPMGGGYLNIGTPTTICFDDVAFGFARVFCNVSDRQGNDEVDAGDYFTFTTGSAAHFEAGSTHSVTVRHVPSDSVMCNATFVGYRVLPTMMMSVSPLPFGVSYGVTFIDTWVAWGDLTIHLSPAGTIWQGVGVADGPEWTPQTSDLSGASPQYRNFSGQLIGGNTTFFCNITDLAGNGILDQGDSFLLTARGYTFPGYSCLLDVEYEPSSHPMWVSSFPGFYSGVTASLEQAAISLGFSFTISGLSSSIAWEAIDIQFMDYTYVGNWTPVSKEFTSGTPCVWRSAAKPLGDLTVFCNVTDIHGSSTIVADGDYFTLTTGSDHQFLSSSSYRVRIMNLRTGEIIANLYFQGVV